MAKRNGPRPKPTKLKVLQGTAQPCRTLPYEPNPEVEVPTCPAFLTELARKEWDRIVPELERLNLVSQVDRAALAAYCASYGRWVQSELCIEAEGTFYDKVKREGMDEHGCDVFSLEKKKHPAVLISQEERRQMRAFLTEFGLTPASRTRISVAPKKIESDEEKRKRQILG